jgi:hypothetical protein
MARAAEIGAGWRVLVWVAGCVPVWVLVGVMWLERWRRRRLGIRTPLREKLLRPAGYSLGQRLEKLRDDVSEWSFWGFLCALVASGGLVLAGLDAGAQLIWALACAIGAAMCSMAAWRAGRKASNCRAGMLGELAVAEKLADQGIAAAGYMVFHDLPAERDGKKWNVDHVVVGPGGVFVLETKARAKRKARRGQEESKVSFDGERLDFSWCVDRDVVGQVRRNADWVRELIREFAPDGISVQPVIVVPGWYVESKGNYPVKAMNAKYLVGYLTGAKPAYDAKDLRGVVKKLDEMCRDLEF